MFGIVHSVVSYPCVWFFEDLVEPLENLLLRALRQLMVVSRATAYFRHPGDRTYLEGEAEEERP